MKPANSKATKKLTNADLEPIINNLFTLGQENNKESTNT